MIIFFFLVFKLLILFFFFFFNDTATTEIYTLSLHDALPISGKPVYVIEVESRSRRHGRFHRSEEHTSELQSRFDLVCRLLLEKKKKIIINHIIKKKKKHKKKYKTTQHN